MKIIKLRAENIKKLVAVEITPSGSVIKITGKNASGKTSVLDSMYWALGGLNSIQAQPIRKGQTRAKVELDLGEFTVKRIFNEGGTTSLTIENKDGLRFKSPQTLLDGLLGKLSFDPLAFMNLEPRKQFETLRQLTGVDLSKLDGLRQRTYDERTGINRDIKRLEVQIEGMNVPADSPKEEVSGAEIVAKIEKANKLREERVALETEIQQLENSTRITEKEAQDIRANIEELRKNYDAKQSWLIETADEIEVTEEKLKAIQVPDMSLLNIELTQVESKNKAARSYQVRQKLVIELAGTRGKVSNLAAKIQAIDEEKQGQIAKAWFPLAGLSFGDGAVTYYDLPMDQASHAEQLRVSMAMAMSLNPKLKVIRITDGSLLDSSSMKIVEDMAKDRDFQVWIEQMDESGKVGIVISEGEVVAVNE